MALEQRQTQIQEGAGLTESRLNRDFVLFLQKWSFPLLLAVLAIAAVVVGLRRLGEYRERQMAVAFSELQDALTARSPASLIRVAEDHAGKRAVPLIARTAAADAWLVAAYTGVAPGAELDPDGKVKDAKDLINAEQRERYLNDAATQYRKVIEEAGADGGMTIHAIGAEMGLAAVEETRGKADEAKRHYEAAAAMARRAGFEKLAAEAARRIESLPTMIGGTPALVSASDVKTGTPKPAANTPGGLPANIPPEVLEQLRSQGLSTTPGGAPVTLPPALPPGEQMVFPDGPGAAPKSPEAPKAPEPATPKQP